MILVARLPADRTRLGELRLDGGATWGPVPCYGKSDTARAIEAGNPERDPKRPYGDHPLGIYRITGWAPTLLHEIDKFGAYGKLVLDPIRGPALVAKENGRYGLLLHGGLRRPGPDGQIGTEDDVLRATFGCLRLFDQHIMELVKLWKRFQGSESPLEFYRAQAKED